MIALALFRCWSNLGWIVPCGDAQKKQVYHEIVAVPIFCEWEQRLKQPSMLTTHPREAPRSQYPSRFSPCWIVSFLHQFYLFWPCSWGWGGHKRLRLHPRVSRSMQEPGWGFLRRNSETLRIGSQSVSSRLPFACYPEQTDAPK